MVVGSGKKILDNRSIAKELKKELTEQVKNTRDNGTIRLNQLKREYVLDHVKSDKALIFENKTNSMLIGHPEDQVVEKGRKVS